MSLVGRSIGRQGEQRLARRHRSSDQHGILAAVVRPGHKLAIVNASSSGALVEGMCRLLPGTSVDLQVTTRHGQSAIRARIARCSVVRVQAAAVWYRAAVVFECPLSWVGESGGYGIPTAEARDRGRGEGVTRDGR